MPPAAAPALAVITQTDFTTTFFGSVLRRLFQVRHTSPEVLPKKLWNCWFYNSLNFIPLATLVLANLGTERARCCECMYLLVFVVVAKQKWTKLRNVFESVGDRTSP